MLYSLLLVMLINGQNQIYVVDSGLTRNECIETMLEYNKAFKTKSFECEGVQQEQSVQDTQGV